MDGRKPTLAELKKRAKKRLMKRCIKTPSGCWEWIGYRDRNGYGRTVFNNEPWPAARLSNYLFNHSKYRPNLPTLHTCDNPPCINPAHLNSGTHRQNHIDWMVRGRWRKTT